jgi:hypothetical protein
MDELLSKVVVEVEVSEQERAVNIIAQEQFHLNMRWWNERVRELQPLHAGRFVCVARQELFVGDDPKEVVDRATAAHPNLGGFLSFHVRTETGPRITSVWVQK